MIVPPGAEAEAGLLLGLERGRLRSLPGGVDLTRRPLAQTDRFAFWRRWLVDEPRGWDLSGRPGSVAYDEHDLAPFQTGAPVLLYVGRFTAVKRLPLLIAAHARASEQLGTPAPLVLVGGHPGEWEGEHPLTAAERLRNHDVFLAGWRAHELLPQALNAADLLEAFGLVLVEAMACGLPVLACAAHGPAAIVTDGTTGWLVPPDDQDALTHALVAAASDREQRRARGERAHAESRHYGWPAIASRLASTYEELLTPAQRQSSPRPALRPQSRTSATGSSPYLAARPSRSSSAGCAAQPERPLTRRRTVSISLLGCMDPSCCKIRRFQSAGRVAWRTRPYNAGPDRADTTKKER